MELRKKSISSFRYRTYKSKLRGNNLAWASVHNRSVPGKSQQILTALFKCKKVIRNRIKCFKEKKVRKAC